jgi:siroheme synthase-like protein
MTLPTSLEPFLEPEAMWSTDMPPSTRAAGDLVAAAISVLVLVVVIWEDVARTGPWAADVTGPLELAAAPLSLSAGWLLAGGALALSAGAVLGRRRRVAAAGPATEPLVPRLPVFLRFDGRRVVVVGGGAVAASKIPALLEAGADVTVVAPDIAPEIDRTRLRVCERPFEPSDLDGAWFVTAAATPDVNRQVRDAAEARAVFVNAVDDSANATAYLGGTIARGDVTVAFSTAGKAPALAGLLREGFDALLPADLDAWVSRAHELSRRQRADGVPMAERRPQLLEALNRLYSRREAARAEGGIRS